MYNITDLKKRRVKMRIFKHRGDIYVSTSRVKSDLEQKILLAALAFIVVFTAVFLIIFGVRYDFSFKAFITPEDLIDENNEIMEQLPEVQGITNYLLLMSNENTQELYVCTLLQVDMDTVSYKACTLDPETAENGVSLADTYISMGAAGVSNSLSHLFGIEIDYYADFNYTDYESFFDYLGSVNYTVLSDVRYKDTSRYGYNIRVSEGNQSIDGDTAVKLMRYYVSQENNYSAVNDIVLSAVSQHINAQNYEKRERAFSRFIEYTSTNITVRDFTAQQDNLAVLSSDTTGVNVYSVPVVYDGANVISESVTDVLGYFSK